MEPPREEMVAKWNLHTYKIRFSFLEPFFLVFASKIAKVLVWAYNIFVHKFDMGVINFMLISNPLKNAQKFNPKKL